MQLVKVILTYGGLGHSCPGLIGAARPELLTRLPGLSPEHLRRLAWAFGQLKHYDRSVSVPMAASWRELLVGEY